MTGLRRVLFVLVLISKALAAEMVVSRPEHLERIGQGKRVGFFLGSFDPIHRGHLAMVTQALDNNYVDHVLIYALPVDGKRKVSKALEFRNEVAVRSLDRLVSEQPQYAGRISLLTSPAFRHDGPLKIEKNFEKRVRLEGEDLAYVRQLLGEKNTLFTWVALMGSDSPVLERVKLHDKYMVRHEHAGVPSVEYDILASTAITAQEFVVFTRERDAKVPGCLAGRRVIKHETQNEGLSSTKVRNAVKAGKMDEAASMVMLPEHDLHLLNAYADVEDINRAIFNETLHHLANAQYPATDVQVVLGEETKSGLGKLDIRARVLAMSTFAMARDFVLKGYRPLVLDMANSTSPCGSVFEGSRAQEETLCRQSNLYLALAAAKEKGLYPIAEMGGILVRNVTFVRDDGYAFLEKPFQVDVFVSSAFDCNADHKPDPDRNLVGYNRPYSDAQYEAGTKAKIRAMFRAAKSNGNNALVLSAFGCGAFRNDPRVIARLYKDVLGENEFLDVFKEVAFAIIPDTAENFSVFHNAFVPKGDEL